MTEIESMSCIISWDKIKPPPIINTVDKNAHFCKDKIEGMRYEYPDETEWENEIHDGDCVARKDGSLWVVNSEYGDNQVCFCPHCGAKALKQSLSTTD